MIVRWSSFTNLARSLWHAVLYRWEGGQTIAPKPVVAFRRSQCAVCPHQTRDSMPQCRICTCFIDVLTLLSSKSCPDKPSRWSALDLPRD